MRGLRASSLRIGAGVLSLFAVIAVRSVLLSVRIISLCHTVARTAAPTLASVQARYWPKKAACPCKSGFIAIYMLTSARKGIPSTQMARELGVTQKTEQLGSLRSASAKLG